VSDIADFQQTIQRQRDANEAMYRGDPEPFLALWSRRDPVSLFGAWGPCRTGWDELDRMFRWVAGRMSDGRNPAFDVEVADVSGDLGYTVGYERAELSIDGGPIRPWRVRVTHVYRREDGQWRLVHRHGDFAPQDESPPD